MSPPLLRRALVLAVVALLVAALAPAAGAQTDGPTLQVALALREPEPGEGEGEVDDLVTAQVELAATVTPTAPVSDAVLGVDLPDGFTFASAAEEGSEDAPDCVATEGGSPDVRCNLGDLSAASTLVLTLDSTGRQASTVVATATATAAGTPSASAITTSVLANLTLRLIDTSDPSQPGQVSFAVRNTSDLGTTAEGVVVEIALPGQAPDDVAATVGGGGTCARLESAGGNIVCQGITVRALGPIADTPVGAAAEVEVTVTGLDTEDRGILAEAKGPTTSRAVIDYAPDGSVQSLAYHAPATRTPAQAALGGVRGGIVTSGAILNREAIALPANEFTPVGGQVRFLIDDSANTGLFVIEWTEEDVHYRYEATGYRNLEPELGYFQDGGVNYDTHQHDTTWRPNGPDAIPDLWVQALVYAEGTLHRVDADGEETAFEDVGMHAMYRQLAGEREGEPWQRWSEKGEVPPASATTTAYGEPVPPVPLNLALLDVLFANTPSADGCTFNGVAGETCNQDLGTFVRLMTFTDTRALTGFNSSGIALTREPVTDVVDRFESFAPLAGAESAVHVGVSASAQTFATAGVEAAPGAPAEYVVLGRSDVFADSLAGSGLAGDNAPILFTPPNELDPVVRAEIGRVLDPGDTVYLLGGPVALAPSIEQTLQDAGYTVVRLAGATRIETSAAIAEQVRELNPDADAQLLARAYGSEQDPTQAWADSIAGGPYAAQEQIPLVLTLSDELVPAAAEALEDDATTYVLGGPSAISPEVVEAAPNAERVAGPTRIETSIEVARVLFERTQASDEDDYVVSPGYADLGWAYGLAAAPHAALADAPLLLLATTQDGQPALADSIVAYLGELDYTADVTGYATVSSSLPSDHLVLQVLDLLRGDVA